MIVESSSPLCNEAEPQAAGECVFRSIRTTANLA